MDVMARIKATIESHPIVLFMKGTPQFPMCGFSSRAVQALNEAGAGFHAVNVLEDEGVRQCVETIEAVRAIEGVSGIHLMAPKREHLIGAIVSRSRVLADRPRAS